MIYFVQESVGKRLIKIGYTGGSVRHRMSQLQVGCPSKLALLGMVPGDKSIEDQFHDRFADAHVIGDWHRPVPELLEFIKSGAKTWPNEFFDLVELEPSLGRLWEEARSHYETSIGNEHFCANSVWYGHDQWKGNGIRSRLLRLVGWFAVNEQPKLRTMPAYDLAYKTVYDALPGCRNCLCVRPEDLTDSPKLQAMIRGLA